MSYTKHLRSFLADARLITNPRQSTFHVQDDGIENGLQDARGRAMALVR